MVSARSPVLVAPSPVSAAQSVSDGLLEALFHNQGCSGLMESSRVQVGAGNDTSRGALAMSSCRKP